MAGSAACPSICRSLRGDGAWDAVFSMQDWVDRLGKALEALEDIRSGRVLGSGSQIIRGEVDEAYEPIHAIRDEILLLGKMNRK